MQNILIAHAHRYPVWAINDLYKLIHQAAMGSEHALSEEGQVRRYLSQELDSMGKGPHESMIDPLSPDGSIVRVHLRPFVALHCDAEILLQAFIHTGKVFLQSTERLLEYAGVAIRLADEGQFPFSVTEIEAFVTRMEGDGFPAVHHSRAFEDAYRPAYRVVAQELLPPEWLAR